MIVGSERSFEEIPTFKQSGTHFKNKGMIILTSGIPHGGKLINRTDTSYDVSSIVNKIEIDTMALSDLELIANGAYSPITGFLGRDDYQSVLQSMRLKNGLVWSIPITLPVTESEADKLEIGKKVKLTYKNVVYGVLELQEKYVPNKLEEAKKVFQTIDPNHPGVKKLLNRPKVYLAGPIFLIKIPPKNENFTPFFKTPLETRKEFKTNNWKTVVGFQTRNPVHRAHEYIQKSALEIVDGLFLNPLVGETKADDIPADLSFFQASISHGCWKIPGILTTLSTSIIDISTNPGRISTITQHLYTDIVNKFCIFLKYLLTVQIIHKNHSFIHKTNKFTHNPP